MNLGRRYVFLDFEATGVDPHRAEPMEVAAARVEADGSVSDRFDSLIRIEGPLPFGASKLTGITEAMLADAPTAERVRDQLAAFVGDDPIIAHNASYDATLLGRLGVPMEGRGVLDSCELACLLRPELPRHAMDTLAEAYGIDAGSAHRAKDDVTALIELVGCLLETAAQRPKLMQAIFAPLRGSEWPWLSALETVTAAGKTGDSESPGRTDDGSEASGAKRADRADWPQTATDFFAAGGPLAEQLPTYEPRQSQLAMAGEIADAFAKGQNAMVEAPTGTGKSLAYLVPALFHVRRSEVAKRVAISTQTKALQDQLDGKDLPLVHQALGGGFCWQVVKGKANYICLERWQAEVRILAPDTDLDWRLALAYLGALARSRRLGDLDHVSYFMKQRVAALEAVIPAVRAQQCSGKGRHADCPVGVVRERAEAAQIVVINHALLMTDSSTLPEFEDVVVDEAHGLEESVRAASAVEVSSDALHRLLRRLGDERGGLARAVRQFSDKDQQQIKMAHRSVQTQTERLGTSVAALAETCLSAADPQREVESYDYPRKEVAFDRLGPRPRSRVVEGLRNLEADLGDLNTALGSLGGQVEQLAGSGRRASLEALIVDLKFDAYELIEAADAFFAKAHPNDLRVVTATKPAGEPFSLRREPIGVASLTRKAVLDRRRSVVLTSATLRVGDHEDFVQRRLGYRPGEHAGDRPFRQLSTPWPQVPLVNLIVPDLPGVEARELEHRAERMAELIEHAATVLGGRTLALFSAIRRMQRTAELLRPRLEHRGLLLLEQHRDGGVEKLVRRMREDAGTVLLGCKSLWQGIDVAGPPLSCVIIEKIPFGSPAQPSIKARCDQMGGSYHGFKGYMLPAALLELRQGAGRLIRSGSDRGLVVLCHPQVDAKRYLPDVVGALPEGGAELVNLRSFDERLVHWATRLGIAKGGAW